MGKDVIESRETQPAMDLTLDRYIHHRGCEGVNCDCLEREVKRMRKFQWKKSQSTPAARTKKSTVRGTSDLYEGRDIENEVLWYDSILNMRQENLMYVLEFLTTTELARCRELNSLLEKITEKTARHIVNQMKEENQGKLPLGRWIKDQEKWTRFLHCQVNTAYRLFVHYTAFNTAETRTTLAEWSFGVVDFDPQEPYKNILPNDWRFHNYNMWVKNRMNGAGGRWYLRNAFEKEFPPDLARAVQEWSQELACGSRLAVKAYDPYESKDFWWEAQVWHVWKANSDPDKVIRVYDPKAHETHEVAPEDLLSHMLRYPLHVGDEVSGKKEVCRRCSAKNPPPSFYECHIIKGHLLKLNI